MRRLIPALAGLAAMGGTALAQPPADPGAPNAGLPPIITRPGACAPATLTRMTVREISPGLAAADRRAQPRVIHRLGPDRLRSEEQPDPTRGGETRLTVITEPDIWTINLTTRSGQHAVDPGPTFEVLAPILPVGPDLPPILRTLEFGCEAAFVALNAPAPTQSVAWGAGSANAHVVTVGDQTVALLMDARRKTPLMISYSRQGRAVYAVRYDEFREGLPDRPDLFTPPKGIRLDEAFRAQPQPPKP